MKLDPQKTIFLIDGSSFLYRAYYGTRPLHTAKGEPVNAIYSFCRMIKKLIDRFSVHYIALVWDSKGTTIRHDIFKDYKATRQAPPSDLFIQKKRIIEFAELIGLHQESLQGYEADDLMYAIAKDMATQGFHVILVTSDKDMGQVLSPSISLYDYFKDEITTQQTLEQKLGFNIEKLPFYFALLGDASDNIPGVKGIGKQTAQQLVEEFNSLEDLYKNLEKIKKPRIKNALETNKTNAFLSHKLFLLHYIQTGITEEKLAFNSANWALARPFFQALEFKSLLTQSGITKEQKRVIFDHKVTQLEKKNFITVTTHEQLHTLVAEISKAKKVAIDTEGNAVNPLISDLVGISLCVSDNSAYYIPLTHKTQEPQLAQELVQKTLNPLLRDSSIEKYFHNAKFDLHMLAIHGFTVHGPIFDTLIAASLVTKDWQRIGLKHLALFYNDEDMLNFQEVVQEHKLPDFSFVQLKLATLYSANDALQTFKLANIFKKELIAQKMQSIFDDIEMPLMYILYQMEALGIYVDHSRLESLNHQLSNAIAKIEHDILKMLPHRVQSINLNSPKQIEQLLFFELQLPPQKKSSKRTGYSTDQEVLEALSSMHPIPALILKYRELYKLQSTYTQALPGYINPNDNRIHTTFSQTRVPTGRLASFDPNMQNIPASGPGVAIRSAFKSTGKNCFIAADYSQIELRVLAYLSQDKALIDAFNQNRDIHRETAARLFDCPFSQVTHEQRQVGKRINFSILYGLTPYGLSKDLNIPFKEAKLYIDKYFAQFPRVKTWMETIISQVEKDGYVTTLWGRRRYIPSIYEKNRVLYDEAKRIAINTVAQGTAAEIVKKGMIAVHKSLAKYKASMLLQIHDELLIEAPAEERESIIFEIKNNLENVVNWNVPLVASISSGFNWQEVSK